MKKILFYRTIIIKSEEKVRLVISSYNFATYKKNDDHRAFLRSFQRTITSLGCYCCRRRRSWGWLSIIEANGAVG